MGVRRRAREGRALRFPGVRPPAYLRIALARAGGAHHVRERLPVDLGMEVGERGTQPLVQHPHPVFIGCRARLRRVIDEIISK